MRALSVEDRAEKRKAKKERQRSARAQAAAREAPSPAVGSSAAQQSPSSAQRSSLLSPELLAAEQKPGSPAQAGAPAVEAVLQAAGHVSAEPAEALPQPAPGEGRKTRKKKGKLSRSGALPSGSVHSAPPVQASPGVPRSDSTAAMPDPQNSIAKVTDEHVVALSSPAEPPESSPSASHSSSSAQRLRFPIHETSFAAHQPQDRGSSLASPGQHAAKGAQALSSTSAAPKEESWQEVRPGRRKLAAKPTAAKPGKGRSGGQTLPEALPRPTAAAPTSLQRAQHLQAPPGFAAGPELPKPGPTQADNGEAPPQRPALHASLQRQPAQPPVRAAPTAMQHWPPLQASARPEPERIPEFPELTAVGALQQNLDHEALLKDLLLQPKASSTTTEQHTVHAFQEALHTVCQRIHQASTCRAL